MVTTAINIMEMKPTEEELSEINPPTLQRVLGDGAMVRLLDFLTLYKGLDYSKTEIARNSGVGWKTLFRLWPTLEKYSLVKPTRRIGRATLYTLNTESSIAKTLSQLAFQISDHNNELIIKEPSAKEAVKVKIAKVSQSRLNSEQEGRFKKTILDVQKADYRGYSTVNEVRKAISSSRASTK